MKLVPSAFRATYSADVALADGANTVTVVATFADGATRSASASVTYDAPPRVVLTAPSDHAILGPIDPSSPRDLTGTVERPVTITGTVSKPVASVTINQQQATVNGTDFRFERFFLREGVNYLTATATDAGGRTGASSITVYVDQTAPLLQVEAPLAGAVTSADRIDVRGLVNDAVEGGYRAPYPTVAVVNAANGRSVAAEVDERFFIAPGVPLEIGANALTVTARDAAGNSRSRSVQVARIAAGSRRLTAAGGDRQTAAVEARLPQPLQILAIDRDGNPLGNLPVTFEVLRGSGSLSTSQTSPTLPDGVTPARSLTVTTDPSGRAQAWFTLGKQAGAGINAVRASHPELAEGVVFTATATRGAVAMVLAEGGGGQRAEAGTRPLEPVSVVAYDRQTNPVPDVPIVFTVRQGEASASFDNGTATTTVVTDKDGRAATRPLLGPKAGTVVVEARVSQGSGGDPASAPGTEVQIVALTPTDGPTRFAGLIHDDKGAPLAGVRVSIGRTALVATTDAQGMFLFDGQVPPGKIDLFIDGRAVTNRQGQTYPSLHFEATAVRGQTNSLAQPIHLPPLLMSGARTVGGSQDVSLKIEGFEGFEMIVKANSVTFPDGSRTGTLVVSPVTADRLPMPPPAGGAFTLPAWTIQPAGTRFDPPIEVRLPNTRNYPAGFNVPVVQWDHDLGQFVPMGRATVTEDGAQLVTDAGSGITKAGWGGACVYDPNKCGKKEPPRCNSCSLLDPAATCPDCIANLAREGRRCDYEDGSGRCGKCNVNGNTASCLVTPFEEIEDCCGGEKIEDTSKYCCLGPPDQGEGVYRKIETKKTPLQLGVEWSQCTRRTEATDAPEKRVCADGEIATNGEVTRVFDKGPGLLPHCVDGCSIPRGASLIAFLIGAFDSPDTQNPTGYGDRLGLTGQSTSFYPACKQHDFCYQTCASQQSTCDLNILRAMEATCNASAPKNLPIRPNELTGPYAGISVFEACMRNASLVYQGLVLFGQTAAGERKAQYCDCCGGS